MKSRRSVLSPIWRRTVTDLRMRGPLNRLRLYLSIVRYGNAHNQDFAQENQAFFSDMQARLQPFIGDLQGLRVLDVGCGTSWWMTLLFHSYGGHVTGTDTEFVSPHRGLSKYIGILRHNGFERMMRTLG